MSNIFLVSLNVVRHPATVERVFRTLIPLGQVTRVHPTLFLMETNVTISGVRTFIRSIIPEEDTVCVAATTQVLSQQGFGPSSAA